jgi:peptide/nickel transport system permease protein
VSFELSFIGLFISWVVSFPLGVLSGVFQDRFPDYVLRTGAYALDAVPSFTIGILLLTYLAVYLNWAPPTSFSYLWDDPLRHLRIIILPTVVVGASAVGNLIRFTRHRSLRSSHQLARPGPDPRRRPRCARSPSLREHEGGSTS